MSITQESAFEANIEAHQLGYGWQSLVTAAYDRKSGVLGDDAIAFVQESQPMQWGQFVTCVRVASWRRAARFSTSWSTFSTTEASVG